MRVSRGEFEELVHRALEEIPPAFARHLDNIIIEVEDLPDDNTCIALGVPDRRALLGSYRGVPLTNRSVEQSGRLPDRITIYKSNLEAVCRSRVQLLAQIRKTVLHEIGHHFGLDEDDLDEVGYG